MELATAIRLIEKGIVQTPGPQKWVDLGAGKGLFTNALASLLEAGSEVYAVDNDNASLAAIKIKTTPVRITPLRKDFVLDSMDWEKWDGVLMANALHFVKDPLPFLRKLKQNLQPEGRLIIVEYDTDKSNPWVPYPLSFLSLSKLVQEAGFTTATLIGEETSIFNRNIYSAVVTHIPIITNAPQ